MNTKKLKIADIAKLAGVSKSTVSFVLNGHAKKHRITEETVKKVEAVAREHNYSPSLYARALKSKQTFTIGLVIPDLVNIGFATIAKRLERLCRDTGYQLLIASSEDLPEQEKQAVNSLIERQVDLIMVASSMQDEAFYLQVKQLTPVILFDRVIETDNITTIKTNAIDATKQIIARQAKGLSECIYIGGQLELSPGRDRLQGYQEGLKQAGVVFNPGYVFHKDYQPESGYQMMEQVMDSLGRPPQALFTASFSIFEGVLRYLAEHDLINSGIRLATFDNYTVLDCLPVKIDSIEQDCELIAQTLFESASALLGNPKSAAEQIILPAKLHVRS